MAGGSQSGPFCDGDCGTLVAMAKVVPKAVVEAPAPNGRAGAGHSR